MPDLRAAGGTYFLGRYRVVDEIGIGGMASVHLARMDGPGGFQKWVAIKKIHPHLVEDESFVQMFLDEARVAARISHPNVATVFDLGKHVDTYWIAMEYLHGEPLREVMRRTEELGTAMPPEIACRVIADAAEGLHAAHELLGKSGEKLGLVHRDVTPHNLFVTYDGVTKVVDFGIAKFSSRMSHTRAGTLKGKLAYMSPEQVHGETIDRRTDIFALGVVLWELTTGQRLFRMESDLDTLAKVQECNVPRPSTLIRGYPVDLEKIVMKALAKNRGERFRTARELSRALQSLLMRRGLFIASDEVAAYTQSIFTERIQKREAHLRWAAEVTQTINVEQLLSKPKIGPEYTNSEVQAARDAAPSSRSASAGPVRPAAGMPPLEPSGPIGPINLQSTGPSHTTAPRPAPRPAAGRPPTQQNLKPGRAQAIAPMAPPSADTDEHPADGDGPTIQAVQPVDDPFASHPIGSRPAVPTDGPTLMASARVQNALVDQRIDLGASASLGTLPIVEPEEEDQDETIVGVGNAREERNPLQAPPTFPHAVRAPQPRMGTSPPPRFPATAQMPPGMQGYAPTHTGEVAFSETLGLSANVVSAPGETGDFGHPLVQSEYQRGPHPTGRSNEFGAPRMQPTLPGSRFGGPHTMAGQGTMPAARLRRRPPMWVVAALSCCIALLVAGIVIAVVSASSSPAQPRPIPSGAAGAIGTNGPFGTARQGFNNVAGAAGSGASASPTAPPPMMVATSNDAPAPSEPQAVAPTPAASATAHATQTAGIPPARPTAVAPPPQPTTQPQPKPAPAQVGALTVVCTPKCDQIVDNGSPLGPGHILNRSVPAGRHVLALSAPNGVKKNMQVEVAPGETREIRISMDK
jgi:serine/threonine-protein kinase